MKDFLESVEFRELQKAFSDMNEETISNGSKLYTEKLEKYILSLIIKSEKEDEPSYRYLIYTILDAGPASYAPLQMAGLLDLHNLLVDGFLNDYEFDFSGREDYEKLSEYERIDVISFVVSEFMKKIT